MSRLLALSAAFLVPAAGASAAPVLEPLAPCYRSVTDGRGGFETEPVPVRGSGFTPGAAVDVALDGAVVDSAVADAAGRIDGAVAAPGIASGERPFTLSATEPGMPAQTVGAESRVVNLTARITPRRASPRRTVRFSGAGFTAPDKPVYAHYVRAGRRKAARTVRLGRPAGACGRFGVRRRQFPFDPAPGRWQILLDQSPRAGTRTPTVSIGVRVRRARV